MKGHKGTTNSEKARKVSTEKFTFYQTKNVPEVTRERDICGPHFVLTHMYKKFIDTAYQVCQ